MTVFIDTREQVVSKLIDAWNDYKFYDYRLEKQDHKADYVIDSGDFDFAIQRKSVNDFVGSLSTLKDDMAELRNHWGLSALLLEGNWRVAGQSVALRRGRTVQQSVGLKDWHNFIISQQLRGSLYIRTNNVRETALVLWYYHEYMKGQMTAPKTRVEDSSVLLTMLPNIGPKRAGDILEVYDDPYAALLDIHSWDDNVEGIGWKTIEDAINWLTQTGD